MSHALFAPSRAHVWYHCPNSAILGALLPPEEPSQQMEEGTREHSLAARALSGESLELSPATASYVEFCRKLWTPYSEYHVELKVPLFYSPHEHGTVDFVVEGREALTIVDLKTGDFPVAAPGNLQLLCYAISYWRQMTRDPDSVRCVIYQPTQEQPVSEVTYTLDDLESWYGKLMEVVAQRNFRVGEHCRLCRARSVCSAYQDSLGGIPTEGPLVSVEQIGKLLKAAPRFEALVKETRKYAKELLASGGTLSGWKLSRRTGSRRWKGDPEAVARELTRLGVSEPWEGRSLRGIGSIEEELGKGRIDHLTVRPEGALSLVEDDGGSEDDFLVEV